MNERSMGIMGSQPIAVPITKDATSGILTPANRAEWDQVMVYAGISSGGPSFVYQMQEASGNLLDSIGGATLTVAGAPSYRQAVAGWSRLAFTFADGGATIASRSTAPIMDTGTTSQLILLYGFAASATVNRSVAILGNPTQQIYGVTTTTFRAVSSTTATGAAALSSAVRPMVLLSDVTAGRCVGYNESDKMVPTYRAGAGINLAFNSNYTGGNLYAACFQQGAAELTDAQIKRLLQTLGWTITWT
jgi:hypothetical protein